MMPTGMRNASWARRLAMPLVAARYAGRTVRASVRKGAVVLMYHQIAEGDIDTWSTSVSPNHFAQHLEVLSSSGRPVLSFGELARSVRAGTLPERAVAVTFDDGYGDNLTLGLPRLEQVGLPATLFVTECAIDHHTEMWWDELERVLLCEIDLPDHLDIEIAGRQLALDIDGDPTDSRGWRAAVDPPRNGRQSALRRLWEIMTPLPLAEQEAASSALVRWAGIDPRPRPSHRMLTSEELSQLTASPLIEIGSHAMTHASLPSAADLPWELSRSRELLEEQTGGRVTTLAYPSGHHDAAVVEAARAAGYTAAATCERRPVLASTDPLMIGRLMVKDWSGDEFARQLRAIG